MSNTDTFMPNAFQTPNAIIDRVMPFLTGEEFMCLMVAVREILGWDTSFASRRKKIALSIFVKKTGLSKPKVNDALKVLASCGILRRIGEARGSASQMWHLPENPAINWEVLTARKEQQKEVSAKRISKAVTVSAKKRSVRSSGTTVVPQINGTKKEIVTDVSGTTVVPSSGTSHVHIKYQVNTIPATTESLESDHAYEGSDTLAAAAAATHGLEGDAVSPKAEVFVFWEKNIGACPPFMVEILDDWFNEAPDPSWVLEALQESVRVQANKKWRYAESILERCRNEAWLEKPSAAKVRKANEKSGGYHAPGESTTPPAPRIVKRPLATCPRCNGEGHFPDPKDRNSQVRCNCWHDVTIDGVAS
jgi:DNA replication protein DnaD